MNPVNNINFGHGVGDAEGDRREEQQDGARVDCGLITQNVDSLVVFRELAGTFQANTLDRV